MQFPEFQALVGQTCAKRNMELVAFGAGAMTLRQAHGGHNAEIPHPFIAVLASLPDSHSDDPFRVLAASQTQCAILTEPVDEIEDHHKLRALRIPPNKIVDGLALHYFPCLRPVSPLLINGEHAVRLDKFAPRVVRGAYRGYI